MLCLDLFRTHHRCLYSCHIIWLCWNWAAAQKRPFLVWITLNFSTFLCFRAHILDVCLSGVVDKWWVLSVDKIDLLNALNANIEICLSSLSYLSFAIDMFGNPQHLSWNIVTITEQLKSNCYLTVPLVIMVFNSRTSAKPLFKNKVTLSSLI